MQSLYQTSSPAAAYNSRDRYDPPKCHSNTRVGLLNMVRDWAGKGLPCIMWLYGSARGTGKFAIDDARGASSGIQPYCVFFVLQNCISNKTAIEVMKDALSLRFAYQLSQSMPPLRNYIDHVILSIPSGFDFTLKEQVMALIIGPLKQLKQERMHQDTPFVFPGIVIVDGLDECKSENGQERVLQAIAILPGK
ncbi:hypothetical protein BJ165DRAFT_1529314 [Panaeolus papilionaceus]|nr:hypothetical protein BJ165DRAFT_1529314 [Panaeolus papilionaceus]